MSSPLMEIVREITGLANRVRSLEARASLTPVRFTVANSVWLTAACVVGATSIKVSSLPEWIDKNSLTFYVVIDAGDSQAECRYITSFSISTTSGDITLSFATGLSYNHAEGDPVIIRVPSMHSKFASADEFVIVSGAPTLAAYQGGYAYKFPDAQDYKIGLYWYVPYMYGGLINWNWYLYLASETSAAGDVEANLDITFISNGELVSKASTDSTDEITMPGVADKLLIYNFPVTLAGSSGQLMKVEFTRFGTHQYDTLATGLMFIGIAIEEANP